MGLALVCVLPARAAMPDHIRSIGRNSGAKGVNNPAQAVANINNLTVNTQTRGFFICTLQAPCGAGGNHPFDGLLDNIRLFGSTTNGSGVLPLTDLEAFCQADTTP